MKISLNWLEDFLEIQKQNPQQLAQQISEHCFEVEKVLGGEQNYGFSNVIVAKVLHYEKHPNADRLRVVKLDVGNKVIEPVVCGANNFEVGDLIALALTGAVIPQNIHSEEHESFTLEKAVIRGVESQGMICSSFELGLSERPEEKPEILILEKGIRLGEDLAKHLKAQAKEAGAVFDVSLPANRPDLYSHLGIAREISGILGIKTKNWIKEIQELSFNHKGVSKLDISIKEKKACPVYIGAKLKVKVGASPIALKKRLHGLGLRSINNVVDITNYVMYEMGEPMHAFDASKVSGGIVVRNAKNGEVLTTIDHRERALDDSMLVIADKEKALAIAGVMGGFDSEVNENTTEIILEAANFEPSQIRKTSKKLGLRSDSSGFWEKGLHPYQAKIAVARAIDLLKEHAGAEVLSYAEVGDVERENRKIKFEVEQINGLLGSEFSDGEIQKVLTRLNLDKEIPWYRQDMVNYADIADEILKTVGFNELSKKSLSVQKLTSQIDADKAFNGFKEKMSDLGFIEAQNYSFISEKDISGFGKSKVTDHLKIKNPLSGDQGYLKRNLLVHLLKNVSLNSKNFDAFKLFEIGKAYHAFGDERDLVTFVIFNKEKTAQGLLSEVKGVLEAVVSEYTNHKVEYKQENTEQSLISLLGKELGNFGLVNRLVLNNFDVTGDLVYVTLDLHPLLASKTQKKMIPYSKLPSKVLDISLVVKESVKWAEIENLVWKNGSDLLKSVEVFEAGYLYAKGSLPRFHKELGLKGVKNLAFHLVFQAKDRTLKDSEIMPIYDKIKVELKTKLGAEIR